MGGLQAMGQMGAMSGFGSAAGEVAGIYEQQRAAFQQVEGRLDSMKYYFNVSNSYVLKKLRLVLFPLKQENWVRELAEDGESYRPPREDVNAPDLYIPLMAFVTYVLVISFVMGTAYEFTPEVLASTASTALAVTLFEVVLLKFGFYLLNAFTVPVLDIIAYSGYKYVGATLSVLLALAFGPAAFWGSALVTGMMSAVYMRNTLRLAFPDAQDGYNTGTSYNRKYFLLLVSILQLVLMLYLGYSSHLM